MKTELTGGGSVKDKLHAVVDAAEHFNSDITQLVGRDDDGEIIFVAAFVKGDYAKLVSRFIENLE